MLCHPAFLASEIGCNTESEALLSEKNVSAVSGVDAPDGVVLREMADITVLFVEICLRVKSLYKSGIIAESIENIISDAGHYKHIQNYINGVGELDSVFCERRSDYTHGVGNYIHGLSGHRTRVELGKLCIAFLGIHPVVDVSCVLFLSGADEGASLDASHVVYRGTMQVAAGEKLLVKLYHFAG